MRHEKLARTQPRRRTIQSAFALAKIYPGTSTGAVPKYSFNFGTPYTSGIKAARSPSVSKCGIAFVTWGSHWGPVFGPPAVHLPPLKYRLPPHKLCTFSRFAEFFVEFVCRRSFRRSVRFSHSFPRRASVDISTTFVEIDKGNSREIIANDRARCSNPCQCRFEYPPNGIHRDIKYSGSRERGRALSLLLLLLPTFILLSLSLSRGK